MRYKNFTIENYKGIQKLTLDLDKKPKGSIFTLVGLNESGKTTVLEAINHLFDDIVDPYELVPKSQRGKFDGAIKIKSEILFDDDDLRAIREYLDEKGFTVTNMEKEATFTRKLEFKDTKLTGNENGNESWLITIDGIPPTAESAEAGEGEKPAEPIEVRLYDHDTKLWSTTMDMIKEDIFSSVVYYPNFLFDFPHRIYLVESEGEDDEQEYYRQVIQDILNSIGGGYDIETHLVERKKSGTNADAENIEKVLDDMATVITKTVFEAWNKISKRPNNNLEVTLGNDLKVDEKDPTLYYIEMKVRQGSDKYFIDERSLGFRWFFAFLLFTQFRKHRKDEVSGTIFLLDEPASNLHQKAQQDLLDSLESATKGSSVVYSTHSHHLIKPEWLPNAFIVKNKALDYQSESLQDGFIDSKTDVVATPYHQYVAMYPNEETHFKPILDALDYSPSKLEYIPSIVIPEGKFDYFTFRYFDQVILGNTDSLHFYPGAGANSHAPIISLYLAWGRDFVILLDDDGAGSRAKKLYLKQFGKDVETKIVTLSDISSTFQNYVTEDLIDEKERIELTNQVFPGVTKYDKSLFNKAVQELLINKIDFSFSKQTKDNFRIIIEHLNKMLQTT